MEETFQALLDLQKLDEDMDAAREQVRRFDPQLEELTAPLREIETEATAIRNRLTEMKAQARKLERGAEDKRTSLERYEERLNRVRSAREEAAARTEIDLVRRAAEADENDAFALLEQITRAELKLDELEKRLAQTRSEVEPRQRDLLAARTQAESDLEVLAAKRKNVMVRLTPDASRLYQRIRTGKTKVAVAALMPDGACGHCFNIIPVQEQNEIRRRRGLHRCEACGVILFAES